MSNLIRRQDAIDVVAKFYKYESDRMTALQELPTVEAKPVVHCRECCFLEVCKTSQWLGIDGYCSRGEKHD